MNTKNIIFGTLALAVVGGGAYFYFKNKKKGSLADTLASSLSNTGTGSSSTNTGTGTGSTATSSTPDKVLDNAPITNAQAQSNQQETEKQIKAQALAGQIFSLKSSILKEPIGGGLFSYESNHNGSINLKILTIRQKLKELGYKEEEGIAVKL